MAWTGGLGKHVHIANVIDKLAELRVFRLCCRLNLEKNVQTTTQLQSGVLWERKSLERSLSMWLWNSSTEGCFTDVPLPVISWGQDQHTAIHTTVRAMRVSCESHRQRDNAQRACISPTHDSLPYVNTMPKKASVGCTGWSTCRYNFIYCNFPSLPSRSVDFWIKTESRTVFSKKGNENLYPVQQIIWSTSQLSPSMKVTPVSPRAWTPFRSRIWPDSRHSV